MTRNLINLIGRSLARELDRERWLYEMRILRTIQHRHPHWYQRLLSKDFITWIKIAKRPWYFDLKTKTTVFKPCSNRAFPAIYPRDSVSKYKAIMHIDLIPKGR